MNMHVNPNTFSTPTNEAIIEAQREQIENLKKQAFEQQSRICKKDWEINRLNSQLDMVHLKNTSTEEEQDEVALQMMIATCHATGLSLDIFAQLTKDLDIDALFTCCKNLHNIKIRVR